MTALDVLAAVLLGVGVSLTVLSGIGLQHFPDVFARMHATTKPAVLGLLLVLVGAALRVADPSEAVLLLLVAVFQLVTAPVGAHMIGRASYRAGVYRREVLQVDELAGFREADPDPPG